MSTINKVLIALVVIIFISFFVLNALPVNNGMEEILPIDDLNIIAEDIIMEETSLTDDSDALVEDMVMEEVLPVDDSNVLVEDVINEPIIESEVVNEESRKFDWKDTVLVDVLTNESFRISDFRGQVVLLESFAVWCPTCLRQQKEMKKVDGVIHISLDTDPNENEDLVKTHALENNLEWIFAVSPIELTQALIDEFGLTIVNAPSAPVLLICEDQSTRFLKSGVKTSNEIIKEIEIGC